MDFSRYQVPQLQFERLFFNFSFETLLWFILWVFRRCLVALITLSAIQCENENGRSTWPCPEISSRARERQYIGVFTRYITIQKEQYIIWEGWEGDAS
jgi:hypothetical protein